MAMIFAFFRKLVCCIQSWFSHSIYSTKTNINSAVITYPLILVSTQKPDKGFYACKRNSNGSISFVMVNKQCSTAWCSIFYIRINLSLCFGNLFCSWSHSKYFHIFPNLHNPFQSRQDVYLAFGTLHPLMKY